jgi:hypothetical protein
MVRRLSPSPPRNPCAAVEFVVIIVFEGLFQFFAL